MLTPVNFVIFKKLYRQVIVIDCLFIFGVQNQLLGQKNYDQLNNVCLFDEVASGSKIDVLRVETIPRFGIYYLYVERCRYTFVLYNTCFNLKNNREYYTFSDFVCLEADLKKTIYASVFAKYFISSWKYGTILSLF